VSVIKQIFLTVRSASRHIDKTTYITNNLLSNESLEFTYM